MKLTGARILMECLREQKVDTIFGYPGGTILNVYDALYDYKEITHILTSHEQGAAHAADGYARSTGKVGVCFATSGPGATNLTTGGFGTMGFGLGAAMGAAVGNPGKVVVHCTGDGCFRMNCHELCTAEHYNIPVITVIFNNRTLGMVRQWQNLIYQKRFSQTDLDRGPDFVKLAEAYGIQGERAATQPEFEAAFRRAVAAGRPYLIECAIDKDAMVHPMVSAGAPVTDFILD